MNEVQRQTFVTDVLDNYLALGLGGLSKKDTKEFWFIFWISKDFPTIFHSVVIQSIQEVSVLLKTPVNKVKQLSYETSLKYGESSWEQVKAQLF